MSNASDFVIENGVLTKYVGPGGDVVIPDGVTSIGGYAFSFCEKLKSIMIPESVTSIGDRAFSGCRNLESVTILGRITNLGEDIFGRDDEYDEYEPNDECESLKVLKTEYWLKGLRLPKSPYLRLVIYCAKEEIKAIPVYYRFRAALGFVSHGNLDLTSGITKSYFEYLKNNAGKLIDKIFEHPELLKFMCEHTLIPAKDYDAYMAKAEKRKNVEIKAMLLDYHA